MAAMAVSQVAGCWWSTSTDFSSSTSRRYGSISGVSTHWKTGHEVSIVPPECIHAGLRQQNVSCLGTGNRTATDPTNSLQKSYSRVSSSRTMVQPAEDKDAEEQIVAASASFVYWHARSR